MQLMQLEAVQVALRYLERFGARARRGHGGQRFEPVRLVAALFEHGTSRAQDPQIHTNALLMNVGRRAVAGCEVFFSGNQPFTLNMETKSSDQADSSATLIGGAGVTLTSGATGTFKFDVNNAMDLVRYKLTSSAAGAATIHLQFSQPLWQPN